MSLTVTPTGFRNKSLHSIIFVCITTYHAESHCIAIGVERMVLVIASNVSLMYQIVGNALRCSDGDTYPY